MSIQITGSSASLPWSCQVPFGVRIRSPRPPRSARPRHWCSRPCRTGWCGWRWASADVHRRDVARIVDRDRAADGVGDLQAAVEAGIEQQDALAVGELDRRHVGLAGDLGDAVQVGAVVLPAPHVRQRLHLVGGDAAGGELPRPSPPVWLNQGRCAGAFAWVRTQTWCLAASVLIASIISRALWRARGRGLLVGTGP